MRFIVQSYLFALYILDLALFYRLRLCRLRLLGMLDEVGEVIKLLLIHTRNDNAFIGLLTGFVGPGLRLKML